MSNADDDTTNHIEKEYIRLASKNEWSGIYQDVCRECNQYSYTFNEARRLKNKPLNRYRDVSPYDHSRIVLKRYDLDYINANYVRLERANRRYILTQGPLSYTVGHFWLMVWEQGSQAILMLNKIIEKNERKCHDYWPEEVGEENRLVLDDVNLTVELMNEKDFRYYSTREIKITDGESGDSRVITQYHYTTWPDFGTPATPVELLNFIKVVRQSGALDAAAGPPVVHCSAGIGRSGTFCLVDCCMVIIENEGIEKLDILQVLKDLRKDRMGLIQTSEQLRFSFQAIVEGHKRLSPDWAELEAEDAEEDEVYMEIDLKEREVAGPPPPPPRAGSLESRPPSKPLPPIPSTTSMGNLQYEAADRGSSSDQSAPPPPPARRPAPLLPKDEDDEDCLLESGAETPTESLADVPSTSELRRRRNEDLSERVSAMKRRAKDADNWNSLKRSLYKPLTITFGVLIAGIVIYAYVKH